MCQIIFRCVSTCTCKNRWIVALLCCLGAKDNDKSLCSKQMQPWKPFQPSVGWIVGLWARSQTLPVSSKRSKENLCNNIYTTKEINKSEAYESLIGAGNEPAETASVRTRQITSCTGHVSENSREEAVSAEMDWLLRNAVLWRAWNAADPQAKCPIFGRL